jgi:hypothetical protein
MLTPLLSNLGSIKDTATGLYQRVTAEGYVEEEVDIVVVSGLAEDLRDILLEYQVSIQEPIQVLDY